MLSSWKIGSFLGIGVYVHWTFWLLVIFGLMSATAQSGILAGFYAAILLLSVFACVVAHEFGHAIAAAYFGIPTADITLLPIGGLARLTRLPEKPIQELVIALAGPAVNVVIAGILLSLAIFGMLLPGATGMPGDELGLVGQLIGANVMLVLFNLLPAFPMDGGRVLRSLLAMRTSHLRATEIAARVGRWMAIFFLVAAFVYGHIGLCLIALFVFLAGTAELFEARRRAYSQPGWVQWAWTSDQSPYWNDQAPEGWPHRTRSRSDDIIDAIEVREIR